MRIKYRARRGSELSITPVEVDGETKHYFYLRGTGRKVRKIGEYETYHETYHAAKAQIVAAQEEIVATLEKWVAKEKLLLEKVANLEESKSEN